jgi:hypothetical protein
MIQQGFACPDPHLPVPERDWTLLNMCTCEELQMGGDAAAQAVQAKVTEDPTDMRVPCAGKIGDGGNMDKVQVRRSPADGSQHPHRCALFAECCVGSWGRHSGELFLPSWWMFSTMPCPDAPWVENAMWDGPGRRWTRGWRRSSRTPCAAACWP